MINVIGKNGKPIIQIEDSVDMANDKIFLEDGTAKPYLEVAGEIHPKEKDKPTRETGQERVRRVIFKDGTSKPPLEGGKQIPLKNKGKPKRETRQEWVRRVIFGETQ